MKRKRIIAWSIVVGVVLSIVLICSLVFTLRKVDYQLTAVITKDNRSRLFESGKTRNDIEESIGKSAGFNLGGNLIFMKFDENIAKIESANPFVKVEKIVRRFPNKITVYYSEREAVALLPVKDVENSYFVVDSSLKVLDQTTLESNKYNLPVVDYFNEGFEGKVGDFLQSPLKSYIKNFVDGAFSANGDSSALYEDVMKTTNKITIKKLEEDNPQNVLEYHLTKHDGAKVLVEVWKADEKLFDKIANSWQIFIEVLDKDNENHEDKHILVYQNASGRLMIVDKANDNEITLPKAD